MTVRHRDIRMESSAQGSMLSHLHVTIDQRRWRASCIDRSLPAVGTHEQRETDAMLAGIVFPACGNGKPRDSRHHDELSHGPRPSPI
eukprot:SAG31_NODE_1094_length_9945_cov_3.834349_10_plen_87_part_00